MTPRRCMRWMLALTAMALVAGSAFAQEDGKVPVIPFDGPEVFSYLLKHRNLEPVTRIADLKSMEPREILVIVFGENQELDRIGRIFDGWDAFLRRGGCLLVASDFPDDGRLATLGVSILGDPVKQLAEETAYKLRPECPLITDFGQAAPDVFHGFKRLATNRPTFLSIRPKSDLRPFASFPPSCAAFRPEPRGRDGVRMVLGLNPRRDHYIAGTLTAADDPGKALVIAGHGLFTNGMLLQPDNDNFEFAVSCLRWLGDGPDGKRRHVLFVVDGDAIQSFDGSLKPPLPPISVPTIQLVNQLLHGLEREGFFVQLLRDNFDVRVAARLTIMLLTVLLLLYGAKKLTEQRHRSEAGAALLLGPYAPVVVPSPLLHQRYLSQVQHDALWEEGRALARQWFAAMEVMPFAAWNQAAAAPPEIETDGGWWARRRLRHEVDRLWQLARGLKPATLSWRELVRLTQALQALNRAVEQGHLRFRGCSTAEIS